MASIILNNGMPALVDEADMDLVASIRWSASSANRIAGGFYAIGWDKRLKRKFYMHRLIYGAKPGEMVDHINGDPLDNRRANLRLCNHTQNCGNSRWAVGRSGYRGVEFQKNTGKWRAYISIKGKSVHLGSVTSKEEAARLYDAAAVGHFGEFATLNFPTVVA
jgi:HNH endonuclease/AP2 domain